MAIRRVTVFGSSQVLPGSPEYETARAVGTCVARHGCELVNGGYTGTMEASARGAREAGGSVVGVTVRTFAYAPPNAYLSRRIETADLYERLARLTELGDLFVVLPGGTGTLLELSLVWEMLRKGIACKPILADAAWKRIEAALQPGERPSAGGGPDRGPDGPVFSRDVPGDLERILAGQAGA
jgi:hypothetical protein